MTECRSFKAQINKNSRILILGSMPGVKSLEAKEYYAHPQNRFWKLMGHFCNKNLHNAPYETKIQTLLENGFALFDVVKFCNREGSLDSNIKNETPNDIKGLLIKYPNIQKICLNGGKAYSAFKKYFPDLIEKYNCCKLPSTSPANARYTLEKLIGEWSRFLL